MDILQASTVFNSILWFQEVDTDSRGQGHSTVTETETIFSSLTPVRRAQNGTVSG